MGKQKLPPPHDGVYAQPEYQAIAGKLGECDMCHLSSQECLITGVCMKTVNSSELDIKGVTDGELRDPFHPFRRDGGRVLPVEPCS